MPSLSSVPPAVRPGGVFWALFVDIVITIRRRLNPVPIICDPKIRGVGRSGAWAIADAAGARCAVEPDYYATANRGLRPHAVLPACYTLSRS